jgi:hypothetical protein
MLFELFGLPLGVLWVSPNADNAVAMSRRFHGCRMLTGNDGVFRVLEGGTVMYAVPRGFLFALALSPSACPANGSSACVVEGCPPAWINTNI